MSDKNPYKPRKDAPKPAPGPKDAGRTGDVSNRELLEAISGLKPHTARDCSVPITNRDILNEIIRTNLLLKKILERIEDTDFGRGSHRDKADFDPHPPSHGAN